MKRTFLLVMLAAVFLFVAAAAGGQRGPITILGNSDFTAENGVVSGSGTVEDPYIIAGWEIDVPAGALYGVKMVNATASFVLRGLVIRGAMEKGGAAVHLGFVSAAKIEDCSIANSVNGVEISSSAGVRMSSNVLYILGRGLRVTGESAAEYDHEIDESNLLNGYPIRYLYGRDGETVSGIRGSNLYVAASRNMTITENEIVNGDGIQLAFVEHSWIGNNAVSRKTPVLTDHGISLYRSDGNTVIGNVLTNNRRAGIHLWLSSGNEILDNQLLANNYGLVLAASDDNRVHDNLVAANPTGIEVSAGSTGNKVTGNMVYHENTKYGIAIEQAAGNRVEVNAIVEAETGIILATQANNNTVVANTIVAGAYGMSISGWYNEIAQNLIAQNTRGILFPETFGKQKARGNAIHDNLFTDNSHHLYLNHDSEGNRFYRNAFLGEATTLVSDYGRNTWTVVGEGNFWEDYVGEDTDGDGFGDDPVLILPAGVEDTAPLLTPAAATSSLGVLATLEETVLTVLTEEGGVVEIAALIADEGCERFVGFRGFPAVLLEDSPGILFVYDEEVSVRFTMETVNFPLDIAFFDGSGVFVGSTTMEAGSADLYTTSAPFQYALELRSGALAELGIGVGTRLLLPEGG